MGGRTMTNKEAKEILERELNNFKYTDNEFVEATKIAIKALEFIEENYPKTFIDYLNGEQI